MLQAEQKQVPLKLIEILPHISMALAIKNLNQLAKNANLLIFCLFQNVIMFTVAWPLVLRYSVGSKLYPSHLYKVKGDYFFLSSSFSTSWNCTFRLIDPGILLQTCDAWTWMLLESYVLSSWKRYRIKFQIFEVVLWTKNWLSTKWNLYWLLDFHCQIISAVLSNTIYLS